MPEPVEQVERAVEQRAARHGDREPVAHRSASSAAWARCTRWTSSAIPQAGQRRAEAADQVVVAAAAAEREAHRRVVDLEDRARVVAELAHEAEVEDHAVGHPALGEQLVQARAGRRRPRPGRRRARAPRGPPRSSRQPTSRSRSALGQARARRPAQLEAHQVAPRQALEQRRVALLRHVERRSSRLRYSAPSPTPTRWRRRPGLVERGDRRAPPPRPRPRRPGRRSARCRPGGTRAAPPRRGPTARQAWAK